MDIATYAIEAKVEETHWWFVCRRALFARQIAGLNVADSARILDVGSSAGTNLRMLRDAGYRNVSGLDLSDESVRWCAMKALPPVQKGSIMELPFANGSFDLVLATDIIEHVDDDAGALQEVLRILRPGGHVLITVPTFASLWGLQDEKAHHKRRYRMQPLRALVDGIGFSIQHAFYFNFLLFAPIWLARRIIGLLDVKLDSENEVNAPWLNWLLTGIFAADVRLAPWLHPPFGVSALVLARKPEAQR